MQPSGAEEVRVEGFGMLPWAFYSGSWILDPERGERGVRLSQEGQPSAVMQTLVTPRGLALNPRPGPPVGGDGMNSNFSAPRGAIQGR